jgi:F1F0 ATPase subunit 2
MVIVHFSLVFIAGMGLGLIYFGGLWLSVKGLARAKHLALFFSASFVLRSVITLLGFYLLMANSWQHLLFALLGFIVMRMVFTRLIARQPQQASRQPLKEVTVETQPR